MRAPLRNRVVHVLFDISAISKGVDGVLEIVGGALLLLVSPMKVHNIVRILTQHELSEDPHDLVAKYLLNSTQHPLSFLPRLRCRISTLARRCQSGSGHSSALEAEVGIPCGHRCLPTLPCLSTLPLFAHPRAGAACAFGRRCLCHRAHLA